MDNKNKKIIAIVVAIVVAVVAVVVAVVVTNNKDNNQKAPDGVIVDQVEIEDDSNIEEIEVEIDSNGNLVVSPDNVVNNNSQTGAKPNNSNSSQGANNDSQDPNDSNANNGNIADEPNVDEPNVDNNTVTIEKPSAVKNLERSYGKDKDGKITSVILSWDKVKADGYEIGFKQEGSLEKWKISETTSNKVKLDIQKFIEIENGANYEFYVKAFNKDANGNKIYSEPCMITRQIKVDEVNIPLRAITVEVLLPKVSSKGVLKLYVNGVEFETREILSDTEVSNKNDRRETFDIGEYENGVELKAVFTCGSKVLEETKMTYVVDESAKVNLRNKDIEILDQIIE